MVHSYAFGDQPALICELVDWARISGFEVVCAGKGTKYLPAYHGSTPDTVWEHYGLDPGHAAEQGLNPQMFNSFLDGTKSAIEMAAVANATGLRPQAGGLRFPPSPALRPCGDLCSGGRRWRIGAGRAPSRWSRVSSATAPRFPTIWRWGVYVVIEAPDDYVRRRFAEYGVPTDRPADSGRSGARSTSSAWRPRPASSAQVSTAPRPGPPRGSWPT